jgi:neprilysin
LLVDFELFLLKLSLAREDRRNSTALYNPITIKSFSEKFPSMDWVKYFNAFLLDADHVTENETIIMINETLFLNLRNLLDATPKR